MKLLILILNRVEKIEKVLEGFLEIGISGATVVDNVGMGRRIQSAGSRFYSDQPDYRSCIAPEISC